MWAYGSDERVDMVELEEPEDVEEARRWRCMAVGSTPGSLARRAKRESTVVC